MTAPFDRVALIRKLTLASADASLSIGSAWNLLGEAADALESQARLIEAQAEMMRVWRYTLHWYATKSRCLEEREMAREALALEGGEDKLMSLLDEPLPIGEPTAWGIVSGIHYFRGERYYFMSNGENGISFMPASVVENEDPSADEGAG